VGWIVFLFFILPVIVITSRIFDNGHGGYILVPIFALLGIGILRAVIKKTRRTNQPTRSGIRIGALLALIYLGNKVYIGTLPWYDLAPPGKTQMADGNAASTIAAMIGWGGLAMMMVALYFAARRDFRSAEKEFEAAMISHVGRVPDTTLFSTDRATHSRLLIWLAEGLLYFADTKAAFDPQLVRSVADVRDWNIEASKRTIGDAVRDVYTVNIGLKDARRPLFQFYCGRNKEAAYQVTESLNQMIERHVGERVFIEQ
jgi:hypothetical protein